MDSDDPDFCVSWLLGLRTDQRTERQPEWAREFQTDDSSFSISRLLGLLGSVPDWAQQYQTDDPAFEVSRLLGLETQPDSQTKREAVPLPAALPDAVGCVSEGEAVSVNGEGHVQQEDDGEYGLWGYDDDFVFRLLFVDEEDEDDTESVEAEKPEAEKQKEDPKNYVHAEPEFLALCQSLNELLEDIDAAGKDDDSDTESIDGVSPEDRDDDDPYRLEWLRQKNVEKAENKHLDRLMSLPGLADVKALFLHAKAKIQAATRRGTDLKKVNFDAVFVGNEGTGKTMVADLYAKFLASMGLVRPHGGYSGVEAFPPYTWDKAATLRHMRRQCDSANGCIAVMDDAHLLNQYGDTLWELWEVYIRTRNLDGNVVIILAGSEDAGVSSLLSHSGEVVNHFQVLKLPNYTKGQLRDIFAVMVRKHFGDKMKVEGGMDGRYVDMLIRRVLRKSNEESYANIWTLKKAFLEACKRQVERFQQARQKGKYLEDYYMTKEDLLGPGPPLDPEKSEAWRELQKLQGLEAVKEAVLAIVNQVGQNYHRSLRDEEPLPIATSRVFLGSSGTGKTTVAKLYARILVDLGVLSKGDVVVRNPSNFIDRYVGGSESNIKDSLEEAEGGVLIIDDAHTLAPAGNVLKVLITEVTGAADEDRCVILCGQRDAMKELYAKSIPGLSRRFPLETAFVFEDFGLETLGRILDGKLEQVKLTATAKAREVAMEVLKHGSARPRFGNGGEVDNLVSRAILSRARRIAKAGDGALEGGEQAGEVPMEPADFDPDWERTSQAATSTRVLFSDFVDYENIVSKFEGYQQMAQGMRLRGVDPRSYIPFTYVFRGPPGTGKTSTARKLGQIFYDMDLLGTPEVVDVSASELVAGYIGQTGPKTLKLLESALGKVLLIDEAYRLAETRSSFAGEAVGELVDAITRPRFHRKLVIVLAGYDEDMDGLLHSNPGLRSRFPTDIVFKPLSADKCLEHLRRVVARAGIAIPAPGDMDAASRAALKAMLARMAAEKGWASGRSVETLGERVVGHVYRECALKGYTGAELVVSGKELLVMLGGVLPADPAKPYGSLRPMGAKQVMTLRDLEGYE